MNEYFPSEIYPPGETLQEALEEREITPADFAKRIGIKTEHLNKIFEGSAVITPELVVAFETQLGIAADFWLNYEKMYREFLAQQAPANP